MKLLATSGASFTWRNLDAANRKPGLHRLIAGLTLKDFQHLQAVLFKRFEVEYTLVLPALA